MTLILPSALCRVERFPSEMTVPEPGRASAGRDAAARRSRAAETNAEEKCMAKLGQNREVLRCETGMFQPIILGEDLPCKM